MRITGSCHCGLIRYEADVDPGKSGICHCTDCQRLSGSAFRTIILTREDGFRLLTGKLNVYVKTGDSGAERVQTFCGNCGTPVYSAATTEGPKVYSVRLGSVDQRAQLPPRFELWRRSALGWLPALDTTEKREQQ